MGKMVVPKDQLEYAGIGDEELRDRLWLAARREAEAVVAEITQGRYDVVEDVGALKSLPLTQQLEMITERFYADRLENYGLSTGRED